MHKDNPHHRQEGIQSAQRVGGSFVLRFRTTNPTLHSIEGKMSLGVGGRKLREGRPIAAQLAEELSSGRGTGHSAPRDSVSPVFILVSVLSHFE